MAGSLRQEVAGLRHGRAAFRASAVFVALLACAGRGSADLITGLTPDDFINPTLERFQGPFTSTRSYDFGNGLLYNSLTANPDFLNYRGTYGMGLEQSINNGGREGPTDGYLGTLETPQTFQLSFRDGSHTFGFYGAESRVKDGSLGRNGILDLEFYDLADRLIAAVAINTAGTFAWNQFHGFASDELIGRVVFRDAGHMVLDDTHFYGTAGVLIPEPGSLTLLGVGLVGLLGYGWRRKRAAPCRRGPNEPLRRTGPAGDRGAQLMSLRT